MKDHGQTRAAAGNIADLLEIVSCNLQNLNTDATKAELVEGVQQNLQRIEKCRLLAKIAQSVTSLTNTERNTIISLALKQDFENCHYNNRNVNADILKECLNDKQYAEALAMIGETVVDKPKRNKQDKTVDLAGLASLANL